jgi:hypothetical protein
MSFLAALVVVPAAGANHVACGDVITADTTLDSDLANCPGDGVVIGADAITLNLAGHSIDGVGAQAGGYGVENHGFDDVAVLNGWIEEFQAPIYFDDANGSVLKRLTVTGEAQGPLQFWHSDSNIVRGNVIFTGLTFYGDSDNNTVDRNRIDTPGTGILFAGLVNFPPNPDDYGHANSITANTITGHGDSYGIYVSFAFDALIQANALREHGGVGIQVSGQGARNRVQGNAVADSGLQGILVAGDQSESVVLGNQVAGNALDGISLNSATSGTIVERNNSSHNGDDGIDSDSSSATLTGNKAKYNDDLGIEAVSGVTDGGGNVAKGNGNPAQCVGVACSS